MKRSSMPPRKTELKRSPMVAYVETGGGPLPRIRKPLARVNRARKAKRQTAAFGEHAHYIRSLPCLCMDKPGGWLTCTMRVEAAHAKSRGAGGKADALVPLCSRHHRELHDTGIATFSAKYGLDLPAIARELWLDGQGEG